MTDLQVPDLQQMMAPPIKEPEPIDFLSERDKKKILADLNQKFSAAAQARVPFDKQWYMNMSFYFGKQWVTWVGQGSFETMKLYEPPSPKWRVRLVANKIKPIIRNELTKLTKERVQYYVLPASTEDSDLNAAKAAEGLSEYLFTELEIEKVKRRAIFWALLHGSGFMKSYYDLTKKSSSGDMGMPVTDPVTAFHMYAPDLQEEEIEAQPFLFHAMAKDPEWVSYQYNVNVTADSVASSTTIEQKFLTALGVNRGPLNRKMVYVKEAWIKPCRDWPDGALITFTQNQLLAFNPQYPYSHGKYPFAKIDHIPSGRFFGDSVIVDLIPLQREYNRTRSQLIEAKNRMAKPQLIAPKGSIDPKKVTSEPGLIITYVPGFNPPQPLPLTQIPQYVIEELDRTARDMDDNSGQYETTKGRTPPGVEAASAIAYLQEENDTRLFHTVSSIEEAIEKTGKMWLKMVGDYWDFQRQVTILGKNNTVEALALSASDLGGNTDFRVQAGSSAPRSRAAKQAFLTEIGKMGWVDPKEILRYLDMVETNKLFDDINIDMKQVQRENLRMKEMTAGPPNPLMPPDPNQMPPSLPINEYDDDQAHDFGHSQYMKTQEYELLPDQIKQVFLMHLLLHRQRMQTMQAIQQQQQPIDGQPSQEPVPNA